MGVVMSLMLTSVNAFAQGKAEYPRYGFWSNWSLGGGAAATWQMDQHADGAWRRSINAGMDLFLQHKQNHAWDTRYRFSAPTFWIGLPDNDGKLMARYSSLTAEFMWSITNGIKGYDPDRRHSWYLFAGAGMGFVNIIFDADDFSQTRYYKKLGRVLPVLNGGLGYSLQFSDHWSFYAEAEINGNDIPNPFKQETFPIPDWQLVHGTLHMGLSYNFGITAADQAIAAQKAMLTQENFSALNSQVNNLERQVANARNNEKRLENRIAELEDQLAQALAQGGKGGNNAAADSLQAVIDQIKADQLNFYAMPFSVLYGVDEWKVSEDEEAKVKAIARVLKDNPDVKILAVGFADYTGSDAYNMKLSEKRANEAKRLLVKKYGIAEDRIQTEYKGKSVAFGDIQYALNRRVSFDRVIE